MPEFEPYADENEPRSFKHAVIYRITLPANRTLEFTTRQIPSIYVEVEESGWINLDYNRSWWNGQRFEDMTQEQRREVYDYLIEWELAEWRAIGPEDSELFATERLISHGSQHTV